jgi:hypothetical protein
VKPAACRSRQKSLRGFAKWAFAAADTRPGLIPQKTTRSPGPRTSGTALRSVELFVYHPRVDPVLEDLAQGLAGDG